MMQAKTKIDATVLQSRNGKDEHGHRAQKEFEAAPDADDALRSGYCLDDDNHRVFVIVVVIIIVTVRVVSTGRLFVFNTTAVVVIV